MLIKFNSLIPIDVASNISDLLTFVSTSTLEQTITVWVGTEFHPHNENTSEPSILERLRQEAREQSRRAKVQK